jgi:hypothetical protein
MIKKIIKNLKPTDHDLNIKYTCTNCGSDHWVTEKAAKYHKFVIVCECDAVLKPRPIKETKFLYKKRKLKTSPEIDRTTERSQETMQDLDIDCLAKCCKVLEGYGFSQDEAESLLKQAYEETKSTDCITLVKYSLFKLGDKK